MNVEPWPLLARGDTSRVVRGVQRLARARGDAVALDGVYGSETAGAVARFQRKAGLLVDGELGPMTWPGFVVPTSVGDRGEAAAAVQEVLDGVEVDGAFGGQTVARLRGFQLTWGLVVDGQATRATWSFLSAQDRSLWPLVHVGATLATNWRVSVAHHLLLHDGRYVCADGVFGPKSGEAVRAWQTSRRTQDLGPTIGQLDWPLLVHDLGRGDEGHAVRALQGAVTRTDPAAHDGVFGPEAEAMLRAAQRDLGLPETGRSDVETWRRLLVRSALPRLR